MTKKFAVKILRIAGGVALLILLVLFAFFFWASSNQLDPSTYHVLSKSDRQSSVFSSDTFRIATYNMGYLSGMTNNLPVRRTRELYEENAQILLDWVEDRKPDILCVQEIDYKASRSFQIDQSSLLLEKTRFHCAADAVNWDKTYVPFPYGLPSVNFGSILSGQSIFSIHSMHLEDRIALARPSHPFYYDAFYLERLAQIVRIEINERQIVVINVHLEAWDAEIREHQASELLDIIQQYADSLPILLAGDFNATPPGALKPYGSDKTLEIIFKNSRMKPALSQEKYFANESLYFTYSTAEPNIRIDYILYDSLWFDVLEARIDPIRPSDHLPVVADFILKQ
jgi:endonuclease/exonuclease/phosphatase family metal-dependent hydrolase